MNMNNNEFLTNNFTITNQPKQNFHYRYETDLNGNTHGALRGEDGEHPMIKLLLPANAHLDDQGRKRIFFVLCSLYCIDNTKNGIIIKLSPHHLIKKGDEVDNNNLLIYEPMITSNERQEELYWELIDYVIVRERIENFQTSLRNKERKYQELIPNQVGSILGQLDLSNHGQVRNSGKCKVTLGFTIFERKFDDNSTRLYRDTIYSCNIYHGDGLRIHQLCNIRGSVRGGTNVTILICLDSSYPYNVLMKRIHPQTKETVWSYLIPILKRNIFKNAAITFTTPRYDVPTDANEEEIEVMMCVMVGNSKYKSNNVKFLYINDIIKRKHQTIDGGLDKNVKRVRTEDISSDGTKISLMASKIGLLRIESKIKHSINEMFDIPKTSDESIYKNDNESIFYEALESLNGTIHLYKKALDTGKQQLVADFHDMNRENLLHYTCKNNLHHGIRRLIGLGCHLNERNYMGQTPLHIALARNDIECILEIQKVIIDYSKYPKELENDIETMFKVYDHDGYTVIHAAVLGEYEELLENMLIFLKNHNINVLDYEVLGTGDTIAHLAAKHKPNIMPLLEIYIPDYKLARNYDGTTVEDLKENEISN